MAKEVLNCCLMTIFLLCLAGVSAWAVADRVGMPTQGKEVGLDSLEDFTELAGRNPVIKEVVELDSSADFTKLRERLPVIKYDGPRYELTEEDKASLRHARATGGNWDRPEGMPVIELIEGTILDLGVDSNLTFGENLMKGTREIRAYSGYNCQSGLLSSIENFGCGTGCINLRGTAYSGSVAQQYHGNPYPTMDVWEDFSCQGNKLQHFGVEDTYSCTNTNNCCGFLSFIGYWNC